MAGIIKADRRSDVATTLKSVAFNFEDISTRASDYLSTVRQQAQQIVAQAQQEAEQIRQQAHVQGRQQALHEAQQLVGETLDKQLTTLVPALQEAVDDIRHSKAEWLKHWEQRTVGLASSIAERVIRRELQQTPEITIELIRDALELSMGTGDVTIQLHPEDYESLRDHAVALTNQLTSVGSAKIIPTDDVSRGGCRIVTEFGVVDQTIEAQLERIAEELT